MKEKLLEIVRSAYNVEDEVKKNNACTRIGVDSRSQKISKYNKRIWEDFSFLGAYYLSLTADGSIGLPSDHGEKHVILYRNAQLAAELQQTDVGEDFSIKYSGRGNDVANWIVNSGHILNTLDLDKRVVRIEGEGDYTYKTLAEFLTQLQNIQVQNEEKEQKLKQLEKEQKKAEEEKLSELEQKRITEQINELKKEISASMAQKEDMLNLTKYIHEQAQLRFHPIVDPIQSRIKFNNLYNDKTIVIAGGPGTGKTTTMIARLKYLTDLKAINADTQLEPEDRRFSLTISQRNKLKDLIEKDRDWMFFSPSQLLRHYLAQAMEQEGLSRPISKTENWEEFRREMMREYGFFTMDDKTPFKNCRKNDEELIYQNSHAIESLMSYYQQALVNRIKDLPKIPDQDFPWKQTAQYIKFKLGDIREGSIDNIIQALSSLNTSSSVGCAAFNKELKDLLTKIADFIYEKLISDNVSWTKIVALLAKKETTNEEDGEDDDVEEEEEETMSKVTDKNEKQRVYLLIRSWLSAYSRCQVDPTKKMSAKQKEIQEILVPFIPEGYQSQLIRLGGLVLFRVYAKFAEGAKNVLLRNLSGIYKRYRRAIHKNLDTGWNQDVLKYIIDKDNKELHIQEQALLLGFVNNLVKAIQKWNNTDLTGKYCDQYNAYKRPIIGIDEATDFSEVEIYAMISFALVEFSSITIAGDIMQRMTQRGLKSWDDLDNVIHNKSVESLQKSYRQSKKMLEVAQRLYFDTMKERANYKAHLKEEKVPKALAFVNDDEDAKMVWIEKRIKEVFEAYGKQLPSIAIFLNSKEDVQRFAEKLKNTDFFFDNQLSVINGSDGQTLGTKNQVRVFPIDTVKGMEFDVVFFHNIDDTDFDDELVKRYLYVGVSRASFYLGVTFKNANPELIKYFTQNEDWSKI